MTRRRPYRMRLTFIGNGKPPLTLSYRHRGHRARDARSYRDAGWIVETWDCNELGHAIESTREVSPGREPLTPRQVRDAEKLAEASHYLDGVRDTDGGE